MSERFVVLYSGKLPEEQRALVRDDCYVLIDTETNHIVGDDSGEPEDAILLRDFSWVAAFLNEQDVESKRRDDRILAAIEAAIEATPLGRTDVECQANILAAVRAAMGRAK